MPTKLRGGGFRNCSLRCSYERIEVSVNDGYIGYLNEVLLCQSVRLDLFHLLPDGGDVGDSEPRRVNEVQVHIFHAELGNTCKVEATMGNIDEGSHEFHTVVDGRVHVEPVPTRELGSDVHIITGETAVLQSGASLLFVSVGLSRVYVKGC